MAQAPTHLQIMERLDRGNERFERIEQDNAELLKIVREMQATLTNQTSEIAKMREIVEAWGAVKTAGRFIKWLGGIIAALAAIYAAIRIDPAAIGK